MLGDQQAITDRNCMYDEPYSEVDTLIWHWFRVVLFVGSIIAVTAVLYFLPSLPLVLRYPLAIVTVSYSTIIAIYYVWSRLIITCLHIELLRRHRHKFWIGEIRGEIGAAVGKQVFKALLEVVAGYISIGVVFGATYAGTGGSTAGSALGNSIYFSFVTLGTIGYGDFSPHGFGRILVCFQIVAYLLYQALAIGGVIAIIGKITVEPGIGLGYSIVKDKKDDEVA